MTSKPTPANVEPFSPTEIKMSWSDGSHYIVPYVELRFACPCASCVDEHTGQRMIRRESINPAIKPTAVHPVGRYALQLNWSDGHSTGIYHYETLYGVCEKSGRKV